MQSTAALFVFFVACADAGLQPEPLFDDTGNDLSLLQVQPANVHRAGAKQDWPQPGDPNLNPSMSQKLMIAGMKMQSHNKRFMNLTLSSIALTPVWYVIQVNGYKILFDALHEFADDPTVQMNAWRGLSDQSHTELGSRHINDYGGRNRGIKYMVEQLIAHPKPRTAECRDHLTYAYEVLQCLSGLLQWDVNGTRAQAAVEAGLLEQLAKWMKDEASYRPTMDVCCSCLELLLLHNASYAPRLVELGVKELAMDAVERFSAYDPTPFYFGSTYGDSYPVTPRCLVALKYL